MRLEPGPQLYRMRHIRQTAPTDHAFTTVIAHLDIIEDLLNEFFAAWCGAGTTHGQEAAYQTQGSQARHDVDKVLAVALAECENLVQKM